MGSKVHNYFFKTSLWFNNAIHEVAMVIFLIHFWKIFLIWIFDSQIESESSALWVSSLSSLIYYAVSIKLLIKPMLLFSVPLLAIFTHSFIKSDEDRLMINSASSL